MTNFVLLALLLGVLTLALLTRPLWWPFGAAGGTGPAALGDEVRALGQQLKQLTELHATGALTDAQYADSKGRLERKLLDLAAPVPAGAAASPAGPSRQLAAVMAAFAIFVVAGGYAWIGAPAHLALGPGSSSMAAAAGGGNGGAEPDDAAAPHPVTQEQIAAMVEGLAARLQTEPDNGSGWLMLARSYVAMGKHSEALPAFKKASELLPDDANLLADYADAQAMANNRTLEGPPMALIARALKIDAKNAKALALAGTAAFDRKDYKAAVGYWETLVQVEPANSPLAQQLQGGIAEARSLAGMPPAAESALKAAAAGAAGAGADGGRVSGTVSLAPQLRTRVAPDDTLFVFARAPEGSRMPLAIVRKKVRDLPLQFTLDDSMAMSPEARLSGVPRVVVGARISKSGNAMPQSGDLQGMVSAVTVGASGLVVEINQEVKQ